MALMNKQLSLGSLGGIVAILVGVLLANFVLRQIPQTAAILDGSIPTAS